MADIDPSDLLDHGTNPVVFIRSGHDTDTGKAVIALMIHRPLMTDALQPYVGLSVDEAEALALGLFRSATALRAGNLRDDSIERTINRMVDRLVNEVERVDGDGGGEGGEEE